MYIIYIIKGTGEVQVVVTSRTFCCIVVRYVIPIREQEIAAGRRSRHFTEEQKKKNRQTRETMLEAFLKSKGKSLDGDKGKVNKKAKDEGKKYATYLSHTHFIISCFSPNVIFCCFFSKQVQLVSVLFSSKGPFTARKNRSESD